MDWCRIQFSYKCHQIHVTAHQFLIYLPFSRIESRYLLILTENLSVLSIILNKFKTHERQPEVVFGSKFPEDVSYTQV